MFLVSPLLAPPLPRSFSVAPSLSAPLVLAVACTSVWLPQCPCPSPLDCLSSNQDPSQPIVFGGSVWLKFGLLSGGAGWVMSRAALDLLGHNAQWCDRLIRKNPPCRNVYCEDFGLCVCLRELGVRMVGLRGMCWTSPGADCVMPLPRLERFCKEEGMQREVCGTDGVPFTYHKLLGREMEAMHDSIGPCALAAPCPAGMLSNGSAA